MNEPRFLTGTAKGLFYVRLMLHVFFRYLLALFRGGICPIRFARLIWRLILLLKPMVRNKVVQTGKLYKLQLYLPAYPSPAFWESIDKFRRPDPGPLTVVFSMTKACGYRCPHCYQRNDTGADLEIGLLKKTAREMQDLGVTMFDIEGGEPLLRFDRLLDLLTAFDGRREIWVNTTGHLLTPDKARRLKEAGVYGVMISLHTPDEASYDRFTGLPGSFGIARDAARMFREAGITVALNSCPTAELVEQGGLDRIMAIAQEWRCAFVQIIHGKSAGAWLGREDEMIAAREKIDRLCRFHLEHNGPGPFANATSASVQVFEEQPTHFGCTAGGIDRFYLNANGEVQPCEFLNVSFGNVQQEEFKTIFARMRRHFPRPGTCWLCATEAPSIHRTLQENGLTTTPLPRHLTEKLVPTWKKGKPTPLYKRLGIYP